MRVFILVTSLLLTACLDLYRSPDINNSMVTRHSQAMQLYTPAVTRALKPLFFLKGVDFPPKKLVYVAIKDEKILEVWAKNKSYESYKYITAFPVLRQSGTLGHKLRQGDKQVPEGIYALSELKPDSQFHMGVKIDYPNKLDRIFARKDKRSNLGGGIFIHGAMQSTGCLSMGNRVAEQIYVLTALAGLKNSKIVISPTDFRKYTVSSQAGQPVWQNILYGHIARTMAQLPHLGKVRPAPLLPYKRYALHNETPAFNLRAPRVIKRSVKRQSDTKPLAARPAADLKSYFRKLFKPVKPPVKEQKPLQLSRQKPPQQQTPQQQTPQQQTRMQQSQPPQQPVQAQQPPPKRLPAQVSTGGLSL